MSKVKKVSLRIPNDPMEVDQLIHDLGQIDRDLASAKLVLENAIAPFALEFGKQQLAMRAAQEEKIKQIQGYCEAHRQELLPDKDLKTATFASGIVAWKLRPPSVEFKKGLKVEDVVNAIKKHAESVKNLSIVPHLFQETMDLIRTKEEVNKEMVLEKPELIAGLDALYIRKDVEDFIITPTEIKSPTVKEQS